MQAVATLLLLLHMQRWGLSLPYPQGTSQICTLASTLPRAWQTCRLPCSERISCKWNSPGKRVPPHQQSTASWKLKAVQKQHPATEMPPELPRSTQGPLFVGVTQWQRVLSCKWGTRCVFFLLCIDFLAMGCSFLLASSVGTSGVPIKAEIYPPVRIDFIGLLAVLWTASR